jgi:hypothetical protein
MSVSSDGTSIKVKEETVPVFPELFRWDPQSTDPKTIQANYKDGVLEVSVPFAPQAKSEKVHIKG